MTRWLKVGAVATLLVVAVAFAAPWALSRFHGDDGLALSGTIEGTQVDVSAKITGRIAELLVREGQTVERGRVIVRLAADELAAEARRADGALASAQAQLRDLLAGARTEEIREAQARAARAEAQLADLLAGSRQQEIEQARAALRNAQATREWAERDFRRAQELFGKELVAQQEVDRGRQAYEVAAANEASARERLDLVGVGPREHEVAAARAELRAASERVLLLKAGPRPDAVVAARAQVAQAEAAITHRAGPARRGHHRGADRRRRAPQDPRSGRDREPGRADRDAARPARHLAARVRRGDRHRPRARRAGGHDQRRRVSGPRLPGRHQRDRVRGGVHARGTCRRRRSA